MYPSIKRFFDLIFSLLIILIISPILLLIFILLFITQKDILYFQERIGKNGTIFKLIKFSTMQRDSLNMPGGSITTRNDSRVTPVGRFLRISKINELPQLFNVLKGEMSFVGPRPYLNIGFAFFSDEAQTALKKMSPGITGISSVVFRDEEYYVSKCGMDTLQYYKDYIFPYKSKLEIWYFENRSFITDFLILFLTAFKILFPKSKLEFKVFKNLPVDSNFTR